MSSLEICTEALQLFKDKLTAAVSWFSDFVQPANMNYVTRIECKPWDSCSAGIPWLCINASENKVFLWYFFLSPLLFRILLSETPKPPYLHIPIVLIYLKLSLEIRSGIPCPNPNPLRIVCYPSSVTFFLIFIFSHICKATLPCFLQNNASPSIVPWQ